MEVRGKAAEVETGGSCVGVRGIPILLFSVLPTATGSRRVLEISLSASVLSPFRALRSLYGFDLRGKQNSRAGHSVFCHVHAATRRAYRLTVHG